MAEPPPTSCPPGPNLQPVGPDYGPGVGQAPVWAVGFSSGTNGVVLRLPGETMMGPHGYYQKILWVTEHGYRQPIRLSGGDADRGSPLWFQVGDQATTTAPVLDPTKSEASTSYLFIPAAGCYVLEATWPGGHWRIPFAAGGG